MKKTIRSMKEEWKTIKGYDGMYQVSNLGRVKSLRFNKERILKTGGKSYKMVILSDKSIKKAITVHQLVAIAFLNHKPYGNKLVIDHINDVTTDNRVENLQIVTHRFNTYKTQGKNSSNYKGVSWYERDKNWRSKIKINGKQKHLGYFNNEQEASKAYQKALLTINNK